MSCTAYACAPLFDVIDAPSVRRTPRRQSIHAILLVSIVVIMDQVMKAWAWRHFPGTTVNSGSTEGMGGPLNHWFSGRVTGAVLDVFDFGVMCLSGFFLVRTPRSRGVFISAALMIAGWSSNLLDRLGMHMVTAPGSVRGAVDFIRIDQCNCNVADIVIVLASVSFLVLIARTALRGKGVGFAHIEARGAGGLEQRVSRRPGPWSTTGGIVIAAALCAAVSVGAVHYAGVNRSGLGTSGEKHLTSGGSNNLGSPAGPPPGTTPVEELTLIGGVVCNSVCRSGVHVGSAVH